MLPFCDEPDRIAARVYATIRNLVDKEAGKCNPETGEFIADCPCCAFWRGAVAGFGVAALVALAVVFIVALR